MAVIGLEQTWAGGWGWKGFDFVPSVFMMVGLNDMTIPYNEKEGVNFSNGVLSMFNRPENTYISSNFYNDPYNTISFTNSYGMVWFSSYIKELRWYFYVVDESGENIKNKKFAECQFNELGETYHWLALGI